MNKDCHLPRKCVIHSSTNGRMNESLTAEWVHYVVGCISFAPRFLVWDTYNSHMTIEVKEALWLYFQIADMYALRTYFLSCKHPFFTTLNKLLQSDQLSIHIIHDSVVRKSLNCIIMTKVMMESMNLQDW